MLWFVGKVKPLCVSVRSQFVSARAELAMTIHRHIKSVFVRAYTRIRFGRLEYVVQHWRSYPGQMELQFH